MTARVAALRRPGYRTEAMLTERRDALAVTIGSAGGAPQPLGPVVLVGALRHT
jgi:anti-sigma-K factor RskA